MSFAIGKLQLGFSNAIHATFFLSFEPYLSHEMEKVTVETFLHRLQSQIPYLFWGNPAPQLKNSAEAAMLQIMGALSPLWVLRQEENFNISLIRKHGTKGTTSWETFLPQANTTLAVLQQKCLSQTQNLFLHALDFFPVYSLMSGEEPYQSCFKKLKLK